MDWLSQVQSLPVGRKVRLNCECGDGNTLVANHYPDKFTAYCFRCSFKEFQYKGEQTLQEIKRLKELNDTARDYKDTRIKLPEDFTSDIPLIGRLWLYRGGITPSLWRTYSIGYSPSLERVVLPVYSDKTGELIWYQLRAVHTGQTPKYLQPARSREAIMFRSRSVERSLQEVVVVEDILSAIRVGEFTRAVSILGTKLSVEQANQIGAYRNVYTWLDSDTAGRAGSFAFRKLISLITTVRDIQTKLDPKKLSNYKIQQVLKNARNNNEVAY